MAEVLVPGESMSILSNLHAIVQMLIIHQRPPGAGLGRLARDIALMTGYSVEANEISIVMAAAAHKLLHGEVSGVIHPFALDFFTNEVNGDVRQQEVSFPDKGYTSSIIMSSSSGTLSYTVGDFVETYVKKERRGTFDAIVTCFFIDTASNIYQYLLVIKHALQERGGLWVNVGPLQWHEQSKLRPGMAKLLE